MTIIACYIDQSNVWIGSDSIGSDENTKYNFGSKLIQKNNYVVGFAGSYRVGDIVRECNDFPEDIASIDQARLFRDKLGSLIGSEDKNAINVMLATSSGIYVIEDDFQLQHIYKEFAYYAIGAGDCIALGSLYFASKRHELGSIATTMAIKSAIEHSPSCGGDVFLEVVEKNS